MLYKKYEIPKNDRNIFGVFSTFFLVLSSTNYQSNNNSYTAALYICNLK